MSFGAAADDEAIDRAIEAAIDAALPQRASKATRRSASQRPSTA